MKKIVVIVFLPLVFGCSAIKTVAVDQAKLPISKDRTLSLVIHESPDFMAITTDKDMFTRAGLAAAATDGNQLAAENGIKDPADKVCRMVARFFNENYGLIYNENSMIKSKSNKMKNLVRLANRRDYLLDVETIAWLFTYEVNNAQYFVRYNARMRLIDVDERTTVFQSTCDYDTASAGKPLVSYENLVENDAAYIKQALRDASTYCADKFRAKLH